MRYPAILAWLCQRAMSLLDRKLLELAAVAGEYKKVTWPWFFRTMSVLSF
jgi:hypothetical protein